MSLPVRYPTEQEYIYTMRSIQRPFNKKFPTFVGIIIGILQMLLNGAIIGLEGGSVAYNPTIDIVYAGFWCSVSFFFTWISMFAFLCFRKTFRWGLVVTGTNCVSIGFAIILIVFDCLFIQNPCTCYLATICNLDTSNSFEDLNNCTGSDGKSRVVKAQLACAATMLASNILFIILFIIILALSYVSCKPLRPSFQSESSPSNLEPKGFSTAPIRASTYSIPHETVQYQSSYSPQYRQAGYQDQTYWAPPTPYFNRIERF